jgi:hypothetical protein
MKKKLMALVWSFKRANTELEEERKNKKEKKIRRGDKEGKGKKKWSTAPNQRRVWYTHCLIP